MTRDCGGKNCAVSAVMTSILRGACSGFAPRPPRGAASASSHIQYPAANCSIVISCTVAHWGRSADRSSSQSPAVITPNLSPSGVGRRWYSDSRGVLISRFSTHTLRHLCLTDLARAGWDIHEIAAFAGHRSIQTTLLYIHLSGRDLSAKLAASMSQIHARRIQMLAEMNI
jgi:hypothetical protein